MIPIILPVKQESGRPPRQLATLPQAPALTIINYIWYCSELKVWKHEISVKNQLHEKKIGLMSGNRLLVY